MHCFAGGWGRCGLVDLKRQYEDRQDHLAMAMK
jgi:hypothetical protein